MIKKSKKISFLLILIPVLVLLGAGIYFTLDESKNFLNNVIALEHIESIQKLDAMEKSVVDEMLCTAQSKGYNVDIKELCSKQRDLTDTILLGFDNKLESGSYLEKIMLTVLPNKKKNIEIVSLSNLSNIKDTIKNIRYDLDTAKIIDINTLLNGSYKKDILDILHKDIKKLETKYYFSEYKDWIVLSKKMFDSRYYLNLENIFYDILSFK
jgi:hypothetical protein